MVDRIFKVVDERRPAWVSYPPSYLRLLEQKLVDLRPWHILDASETARHFEGLKLRYPSRSLFPFAHRQDNDDVACWTKGTGDEVFVVHDFASPGWEDREHFATFWEWFKHAVDETISWE